MSIKDQLTKENTETGKLQNPELLYNIIKEIQKHGIVGEEPSLLVLINKIMLRLVKNKHPTSDNLIVSDKTGGGKDYIVTKTCDTLLPKDVYFHRTDLSDKVFDYWKPIKEWIETKEGKQKPVYDTWNGKIIHLEDPREDALNGQSFKVMSSGGNSVTKVINHFAVDIIIDGKPGLIVTSLTTMVDIEGMRRWDTLRVDITKEQTQAINKHKLLLASGQTGFEPDTVLINAIHNYLSPKEVIIPYAPDLYEILPDNLLSRTQTDKLLDFIKASAVLHQYQRKQTDNNGIEANGYDLAYGWYVFTHLNSTTGIPTNRDEEELVKVLLKAGAPLSIKDLSERYTLHAISWIYNNKDSLISKGLIKTQHLFDSEANKPIEHITYGENADVVLSGFTMVLLLHNKISFTGFTGFTNICIRIDKNREKCGLKKVFLHILSKTEKTNKTSLLEGQENQTKTTKKPLSDKINDLKEYCKRLEDKNNNVTYTSLCDNFGTDFIEQCKKNKILIPTPKGHYTVGGV